MGDQVYDYYLVGFICVYHVNTKWCI